MNIINHLIKYTIPFILIVLGGLWISISRINPDNKSKNNSFEMPFIGYQAPEFNLTTLDGKTINLSDTQGNLVFINFWASWCLPCKIEMPMLERIFRNYDGYKFFLLGINTTNQDDLRNVQKTLSEMEISFPVLLDQYGTVSEKYQVTALPKSFLISPDGIILDIMIGGPLSEALLRIKIDNWFSEN